MSAVLSIAPIRLGALVLAFVWSLGAALAQDGGEPMRLPVDPAPLTIEDGGSLQIEIAETNEQRARGLMFRTDLPDDRGMLFVFERIGPLGFWMKNTPTPLDLVFIGDDGRVVGILPGEPYSTDGISPGVPARFVLEVKRGIAEKAGIAEGVRLNHPRIDEIAGN